MACAISLPAFAKDEGQLDYIACEFTWSKSFASPVYVSPLIRLEGIVPTRSENLPASLRGTKITQAGLDAVAFTTPWHSQLLHADRLQISKGALCLAPSHKLPCMSQIISKGLAARASYFPSLVTSKQVSPSFFNAPAAEKSLLPDGNIFRFLPAGSQLPEVRLFF